MYLCGKVAMANKIQLPSKIYLEDYSGNYELFIDAVYHVFENDFIKHKTTFGSHILKMKFNPMFQKRAYTFYHMTHEGEKEDDRTPDLRRCECIPWAKPTIENVQNWKLKFWRQSRNRSDNRICIWLECSEEVDDDYFIILEVRETYVLLWTAFMSKYSNASKKKLKEYQEWKNSKDGKLSNTPDELVKQIQDSIKSKERT